MTSVDLDTAHPNLVWCKLVGGPLDGEYFHQTANALPDVLRGKQDGLPGCCYHMAKGDGRRGGQAVVLRGEVIAVLYEYVHSPSCDKKKGKR